MPFNALIAVKNSYRLMCLDPLSLVLFNWANNSETKGLDMPKMKAVERPNKKFSKLTDAQTKTANCFGGYSSANPTLTFEQVSLQELGKKLFGKTLNAKQFEQECRRVFDLGRES
jgi:hypothetical protein